MVLSTLFSRLFPKFEPKTVSFGRFGTATSDRYDVWVLDQPIVLGEYQVELNFCIRDGTEPSDSEIHRCELFVKHWPNIWESIKTAVRQDIFEQTDEDAEAYLAKAFPTSVTLFGFYRDAPDAGDVWIEPELFDHLLRAVVEGDQCTGAHLEG